MPAIYTPTTPTAPTSNIILPAMSLRGIQLPEDTLTINMPGYNDRPELVTGYPLRPVTPLPPTKRGRPALNKPANPKEFYVWHQVGETGATHANGQRCTKPVCRYVEVHGAPVHIPGYAKLDLFIHQDDVISPGYFEIIDGYTGELWGDGRSRRDAIDCASQTLSNEYHNLIAMFEHCLRRRGWAPRYLTRGTPEYDQAKTQTK